MFIFHIAGISFYRLPLKDPNLLKQWLVKIQRGNIPLNEYSRVCSEHCEGGKKVGKKPYQQYLRGQSLVDVHHLKIVVSN